jgi:hypothetical protein
MVDACHVEHCFTPDNSITICHFLPFLGISSKTVQSTHPLLPQLMWTVGSVGSRGTTQSDVNQFLSVISTCTLLALDVPQRKTGVRIHKYPGFLFSGKPVVWFDFYFFQGIIFRVQHHHKHYRDAQTKCIGRTEITPFRCIRISARTCCPALLKQ